MTSVLVVDDDDAFRGDVVQELRAHGYDVTEAANVLEAANALESSPPDVVLTDLRMKGRDGIDLLSTVRRVAPSTLPILMSGFATAEDYQRAMNLGAVRVLTKPFTPQEMLAAVAHALDCGTGFRGSVHGIALVDMLQIFHLGRRTILLHIGNDGATIEFRDGEIVDARRGSNSGTVALREILNTSSGAMSTSVPIRAPDVTITVPFQSLLMDSLREIDECGLRHSDGPVDVSLDGAFEEWASLRPQAPERHDPGRLRALESLVARIAPDVAVAVIDEQGASLIPLRDFEPDQEWVGLAASLQLTLTRLTQSEGYEHFEHVGRDVAFALLRNPEQRYTLLLEAPLLGRLAVQRFRSQVRHVMSCLPAPHAGGGG